MEREEKNGFLPQNSFRCGADLPSVEALAFLGDAVHSLYVRGNAVEEGLSSSGRLHERARDAITAEAQARLSERIEPLLTEAEADVFRRAANHRHLQKPKHMTMADYRRATGFEAVLGMLWWTGDAERIALLLRSGEQTAAENAENSK